VVPDDHGGEDSSDCKGEGDFAASNLFFRHDRDVDEGKQTVNYTSASRKREDGCRAAMRTNHDPTTDEGTTDKVASSGTAMRTGELWCGSRHQCSERRGFRLVAAT
jgi:hypothetical protein